MKKYKININWDKIVNISLLILLMLLMYYLGEIDCIKLINPTMYICS